MMISVFPQRVNSQEIEELDDPNEAQYLDQLLDRIFQTFSIETADSLALDEHGYSEQAILSILEWQQQDESVGTPRWLRKQLRGQDKILLKQDLKSAAVQTQSQFRQRLQYSASLKGWRTLNKGRIWNNQIYLNILTEQDPGEDRFTDHAVMTLSSRSVPGFDNLILGDFHVNWGGGLILNQQGSRMSLNPRSLVRQKRLLLRPHYSSREVDYFRGLAGSFSHNNTHGSAFISRRKARGRWDGETFKEDADGIHPMAKSFEIHTLNALGLAVETEVARLRLFGATLIHPDEPKGMEYELGLACSPMGSHSCQIYTNSLDQNNQRILFSWMYSTKPIVLSFQYRRYNSIEEIASGYVPTLLGASAINETGIAFRVQIRPGKKIQIRYALETGGPEQFNSIQDYRTIQHHKAQLVKRLEKGILQLDLSRKLEYPVVEGSIWESRFTNLKITKAAVSLVHPFSAHLNYRVNLKSTFLNRNHALLVQQRLSGERNTWKWSIGYVRYSIPTYPMRLSVYETSVAESFSFYTAYDDGDRWFIYLKQQAHKYVDLELKVVQTRSFDMLVNSKQLALSLQMSIVL